MGTFYWSYSQSAGGAAGDFLRSREANLAVLIMRLEYISEPDPRAREGDWSLDFDRYLELLVADVRAGNHSIGAPAKEP